MNLHVTFRLRKFPFAIRQWPVMDIISNFTSSYSSQNASFKNSEMQYKEAICCLNSLQSNAAIIEKIRKGPSRSQSNIPLTQKYLNRLGIDSNELNKLSIIHVAGTKGKGSTCAFVESILQEHGYRTGFYSSPHLVTVRERIRINGQPISEDLFIEYFWDVYNTLQESKTDEYDMPAYFKFLTILSLKIFLKERVNVVILEVGIGGEYDCTNVIRKPIVCGITSLDLDHTSILGNTMENIAWHKSGIMKEGIPCFTVDQCNQEAHLVLDQRQIEKKTDLLYVPSLEKYNWGGEQMQLGLSGDVQYLNASLALQLSHYWLINHNKKDNQKKKVEYSHLMQNGDTTFKMASPFDLTKEDMIGLKSVVWPGRTQVLQRGNINYFLDGAHTKSSIIACIDWFNKIAPIYASTERGSSIYKVLLFNSTGDRDPEILLRHLALCDFDIAIFSTNLATTKSNASSDQTNYTITHDQQHLRCERQRRLWIKLIRNKNKQTDLHEETMDNNDLVDISDLPGSDAPSIIFPCINDALIWLSCGSPNNNEEMTKPPAFLQPEKLVNASEVQVLVTGSLHLVGGVLGIIDPELSSTIHSKNNQPSSISDLVRKKYRFKSPATS